MLIHGDSLEVLPTLDAESIDAIVTDPPYGLAFMGKAWDHGAPGIPFWAAMLRVAKPGAYLLAFGGTRTVHRLASAIEDAGWEIRDTLVWAYASGFPKSLDVSKAIDKAAGAERDQGPAPATDAAREWQGWGTALKPAWEPIVMARKPLRGTVAGNVQAYGTGALNIDGCRIAMSEADAETIRNAGGFMQAGWQGPDTGIYNTSGDITVGANPVSGRWPANVILTDPIFDGDTPGVVGGGMTGPSSIRIAEDRDELGATFSLGRSGITPRGVEDSGTYSRFFLIPKAARSDREPVLGGLLPMRHGNASEYAQASAWLCSCGARYPGGFKACPKCGGTGREFYRAARGERSNVHPTVKPTDLMRHLVRLVTPPGGTVLDPFLGSGTTALAAEMEGFGWVGIEREAEYVAIAEARLNGTQRGLGLVG